MFRVALGLLKVNACKQASPIIHVIIHMHIPYSHERAPMGGEPYMLAEHGGGCSF